MVPTVSAVMTAIFTMPDGLASWYAPHILAWKSSPQTTLWFWNSEVGWAEVHPVLRKAGWVYRECCIWDKGIAHAAGNTNTKTLRKYPVVTEVCVQYVRSPRFVASGTDLSAQDWLRSEWRRTSLPYSRANTACGVSNAATRKYLTPDHLWYFPPAEVFVRLVDYANTFGAPEGRPYFSLDGKEPCTGGTWQTLRAKFHCEAGITNVWQCPALRGNERIKVNGGAAHPNQKPLALMRRLVSNCTDTGDVVWEPFGGLCTGSIAANELGRVAYAAEIDEATYQIARQRIDA